MRKDFIDGIEFNPDFTEWGDLDKMKGEGHFHKYNGGHKTQRQENNIM